MLARSQKKKFTWRAAIGRPYTHTKHGAVLVSTGVVRLDKRAAAPDRDKTGNL